MKKLVIILGVLASLAITAQESTKIEKFKIESFAVNVTVDSLEDLNSTFNLNDFDELLDKVSPDQTISFKLTCNNQSKNEQNHISYSFDGNSNKPDEFREQIAKIRNSALNFYSKED